MQLAAMAPMVSMAPMASMVSLDKLEGRFAFLLIWLISAVAFDCRYHRIPNPLVASGIALALTVQILFWGLAEGFATALSGSMVGLLVFLPLYLLRALGAGDVKLMALVGAFLGPREVLYASFWVVFLGGICALVVTVWRGNSMRLAQNLVGLFRLSVARGLGGLTPSVELPGKQSAGKLPYAVPIALGTLVFLFVGTP
jgi:prepilin peptidase CpaA